MSTPGRPASSRHLLGVWIRSLLWTFAESVVAILLAVVLGGIGIFCSAGCCRITPPLTSACRLPPTGRCGPVHWVIPTALAPHFRMPLRSSSPGLASAWASRPGSSTSAAAASS